MCEYKKFNKTGTILRKHQLKMLDMLIYIDGLCKENNIQYFLSGGTLLGAIRHKGFIPWDDDLDIILMKNDYKKLTHILTTTEHELFDFQSNETDPNYLAPYSKLRLKNTLITEANNADINYKYKGIYIDLFFVEPCNKTFHRIADTLQTRLIKLVQFNPNGKHRLLATCYSKIIKSFLFPFFGKLSSIFNHKMISYPIGSFFNTQFKKEWFDSPVDMEFEGKYFSVPKNYEEVLQAQYGNYMEIPSLDSIVFHITHVEFND